MNWQISTSILLATLSFFKLTSFFINLSIITNGCLLHHSRFYGFIGLAGIMTLIVVLLAIGLCCGIISYDRDKTPTNRSAASHHGGNMIMA